MRRTAIEKKPDWDAWREKLRTGEATLAFAPATRGALLYEIPRVLYDIDAWFVSDESALTDFDDVDDEVKRRAREAWGIELSDDPEQQYLWHVADQILGAKAQ